MISRDQIAQGVCFMNEQQPNSPVQEDFSGLRRRETLLQ